jgi:GNAT superfamily N-acetyltransferase
MDTGQIISLYDAEMRIDPPTDLGGTLRKQPGLIAFDAPDSSSRGGWILYTHLDEASVDAAIKAQVDHYQHKNKPFEWKVFDHDKPANLKARLLEHDFEPEPPEALMVLDLANAPTELWQPPTHTIHRITHPDEVDCVVEVLEEVYQQPRPHIGDMLRADLVKAPDLLSVYLAMVDDQPASCAWVYFHRDRQFGELFGGSTVPEFRGRGFYKALVAVRAQEARLRRVRFLSVDASDMSRPILERLGFKVLLYSQPFVWEP